MGLQALTPASPFPDREPETGFPVFQPAHLTHPLEDSSDSAALLLAHPPTSWYTLTVNRDSEALPPHYRWNFTAFLVDFVCFSIAFTLVSLTSVLPAFVRQLTSSAPVIGLVSTVFTGGWLLPQLAAARLINDKPRKKPYLLAGTGQTTVECVRGDGAASCVRIGLYGD